MEAFSLLKFWRLNTPSSSSAVDPLTHAPIELVESESESNSGTTATDSDSEDSFFDLEFTRPDQQHSPKKNDAVDDSSFPESPNNLFCNSSKPQSPISFLRSPSPKFSVLMFFKKPKSDKTETITAATTPDASPSTPSRFAVKCDVVDDFPIWSVLSRVSSYKTTKSERKTTSEEEEETPKRTGKVQRYLKLIKPNYGGGEDVVKVSATDPAPSTAALARSPSRKQGGSKAAAFRVVSKLGKSRSAGAGVVAPVLVTGSKSDDSMVLHNDGIQGAILHCKRSFNNNSPRDLLSRSRFASEASEESSGSCRNSSGDDDEKERISI